jgi:hypothetical protein
MTDCRECGGTSRKITGIDRSGDVPVLIYERCHVCGDIYDAITDADNAMRRGDFGRSKKMFAVAMDRCNHAIQEAAA